MIVPAVDRAVPGRTRYVPGVFAVRSNHLWAPAANDETARRLSKNLSGSDVGARSRAEAERMGIDVLNPVVRDWPEWVFSDYVAGPAAVNRAGCAAWRRRRT